VTMLHTIRATWILITWLRAMDLHMSKLT